MSAVSTDFSLPTFLERAKAQTLSMPLYRDGLTPAAPTTGTFNLYDQSKVVVVTGAVTITSGIATYPVLAASIPVTTNLSNEWQEEWVLTLSDGEVCTIRRDCYLCLRSLYNVVNEAMLIRKQSDLGTLRPPNKTSFQGYIDEAWSDVQGHLLKDGKRPFLIMDPWCLKSLTLNRTLQYIMDDLEIYMGSEGRYAQLAKKYKEAADVALTELKLEYDLSQSNLRSAADDSAAAVPVIYTNTPPYNRWTAGWTY